MRPCRAKRAGTQAPPLPISTKPRGVPLPHRGYTFDSAGLASATQPTLGNNASEEATPLGVVLFPPHCFLMSSPTHTSGAGMHRALPPPLLKIKKCVYRYDFIVTARRGNNICAVLSSPRGAGTIFLPIYRRRSARKQYLCQFIVTARRGNNIFDVLSSPCSAGTIFLPIYRRRAAREQYLCQFIVAVQRGNDICAVLSSPCSARGSV